MRSRTTILLVITVPLILSIASMPVLATDYDIGYVTFNNGTVQNSIDSSASGTVDDTFHFHALFQETRSIHGLYDCTTAISTGDGRRGFVTYVIGTNQQVDTEGVWIWSYAVSNEYTATIKSSTTDLSQVPNNYDSDDITIDVNGGATIGIDWKFAVDFYEYPDSTIEVEFSDSDYVLMDVPDADNPTEIETEHGHVVAIDTNGVNGIVCVDIQEAGSVLYNITFSMA